MSLTESNAATNGPATPTDASHAPCPVCGTEVTAENRFCGTCGTPVGAPVPAAAADQPAGAFPPDGQFPAGGQFPTGGQFPANGPAFTAPGPPAADNCSGSWAPPPAPGVGAGQPSRPGSPAKLAAIVVLVVVLVGGVLVAALGTGKSGHTLRGTFALFDTDAFSSSTSGSSCTGGSGYDDIREGADVNVYNETGKLVATSSLLGGTIASDANATCTFPFSVSNVPDAKFYKVEVSHRGGLTYSAADMRSNGWDLSLTLGS